MKVKKESKRSASSSLFFFVRTENSQTKHKKQFKKKYEGAQVAWKKIFERTPPPLYDVK